ncbi:hypothetical protein ACTOWA_00500 [Herbaspirillum seropedicae]|uniref:hypothetical protein n=1 Tax=Herbaspirillum seropedicae TaxID=964 RepID=UPI00285ED88A|nr:hypothetical protein [Herbaspirillum seropedicae]MDR6397927.1 hypothetical protein [Herbaspirillum seropedicae]
MRKQYTDEQIREAARKYSGQPADIFYAVCFEILGYTPLGQLVLDMSEFDEFTRRYDIAIAGGDSLAPNDAKSGQTEVDIIETLKAKVLAGQPIYFSGQLTEANAKIHLATVNRLRELTGLPVHVIYS